MVNLFTNDEEARKRNTWNMSVNLFAKKLMQTYNKVCYVLKTNSSPYCFSTACTNDNYYSEELLTG